MESQKLLEQGLSLHQAGRLEDAERLYRQVLEQDADNQDALHFLGLIAHHRGAFDEAARLIAAAIEIDEPRATFHYNLAAARIEIGEPGGAIQSYRRVLELQPDHIEAAYSLGALLGQDGRAAEALQALDRALGQKPGYAEALAAKSAVLEQLGRSAEAVAAGRLAVAAGPNLAEAWTNLGTALAASGALQEAEQAHRRAVELKPDYATAHFNLGNLLNDLWRGPEARAQFRRALELDPSDKSARGNHLMNLLYDTDVSEAQLFEEHRKWGLQAPAGGKRAADFASRADPDRRLRVGYVSADFRTHSCAYFLQPLFANHDKGAVESFAYSSVRRADETTQRLEGLLDHWRPVAEIADAAVAELVAADGIDILVDLAGYSGGGRLGIFALKPAPVQISWLGYAATTGMAEIDYRFTDAIADPQGAADDLHSERLIRLAGGFHCYAPPATAPEVAPPPSLENGFVTFASFNNPSKLNRGVISVWASLLRAVPDARLLLKGRGLDFEPVRARILAAFGGQGIEASRIETMAWMPRQQNPIGVYARADIALDTFPYNGTTTTLEALWMGLPVVTLAGARHSGRVGASLLSHAGFADLIAADAESYVDIAASLAADSGRMSEFRGAARGALGASPLLDGPGFAGKIETAYRDVWRR
ncbi:MAG: tetratricopeptide repeat protein [Rhodospirillales bacterium]|jgi:predicted O-linked N-acetylglucosamine transferase (SPINDLY family)|nr:hypothetical protein [Rhodospirillaceae bacterium]MDP6427133.1 tetratricopeptide repeat protein [Rhodospirillales bacterium]MDP6646648.1 tetratricopeptide repeat protein [Rhodospirillales bacterium]MDP6840941.1 tetratricopeptide repeat protein [Rhodospirillales bacterium]